MIRLGLAFLVLFLLLPAGQAQAARVALIGFEVGNSTEPSSCAGTWAIQGTTVRTGSYALQINPTTTGAGSCIMRTANAAGLSARWNVATQYAKVMFRAATLPATASEEIAEFRNTSPATRNTLRVNSAGNLMLFDSDGTTQIGSTGTAVLSLNTWYRIDVKLGTGTSAPYEVQVDGTVDITGTANLNATNHGAIKWGKVTNRNGNTVDFFYDDAVVDDAATVGASQITVMTVDSNGSTMQWTAGTAPSDWTTVDEIPPVNTDYVQSTAQNDVALFGFVSTGTAGISGTIQQVMLFTRSRENAAGTSNELVRIRSGTTNADTTGADPSTTATSLQIYRNTDPADGLAWTTGDLDAVEGGFVDAGTNVLRGLHVSLHVEYTPSAGAATPERTKMGVGQ